MVSKRNHKLDAVTATIVQECGSLGLFHYNKLAYLAEYFFIKNFGARFTGEQFLKLPHGPVISQYKQQIKTLFEDGSLSVDISKLNIKRKLDDDYNLPVIIKSTEKTNSIVLKERILRNFIKQIITKFGKLSTGEIERVVYSTEPVKKYIELAERGYRKKIGGYILKSDCIRITDYKSPQSMGRLAYVEHIKKYPSINVENQKAIAEDMSELVDLRPRYCYHEE